MPDTIQKCLHISNNLTHKTHYDINVSIGVMLCKRKLGSREFKQPAQM